MQSSMHGSQFNEPINYHSLKRFKQAFKRLFILTNMFALLNKLNGLKYDLKRFKAINEQGITMKDLFIELSSILIIVLSFNIALLTVIALLV